MPLQGWEKPWGLANFIHFERYGAADCQGDPQPNSDIYALGMTAIQAHF
jgi:hypothetical protein